MIPISCRCWTSQVPSRPPEMQHAEAWDTSVKARLDILQTLEERQGLCTAISHQWLVPSLVLMIPLLLKAVELDPSHPISLRTPASIVHSPLTRCCLLWITSVLVLRLSRTFCSYSGCHLPPRILVTCHVSLQLMEDRTALPTP